MLSTFTKLHGGSVLCWGIAEWGGDCRAITEDLKEVVSWEAMGSNGKQWEAMGSNGKGSAGTAKLLLELLTLYLSNKATSDGILEAGKA